MYKRQGFRVDRSVSYQQMVLLLTRHSQGNRLPALGDGHYDCPQDSCVERCHRAFNAFSSETCLTSALHRLVAIAQKELKSERGALFRRDEDNRLACVAAVNLTDMELKSEQMRPCLEWLDGFSDRPAAPGRGEQGLCLPLDIGESGLWLLYLDVYKRQTVPPSPHSCKEGCNPCLWKRPAFGERRMGLRAWEPAGERLESIKKD